MRASTPVSMNPTCTLGGSARRRNRLVQRSFDRQETFYFNLLGGSFQTLTTSGRPKIRVSYQIATQTPQYEMDTLQGLAKTCDHGTESRCPAVVPQARSRSADGHGRCLALQIMPVIDIFAYGARARSWAALQGKLRLQSIKARASCHAARKCHARPDTGLCALVVGLCLGVGLAIHPVYLLISFTFSMGDLSSSFGMPAALAEWRGCVSSRTPS